QYNTLIFGFQQDERYQQARLAAKQAYANEEKEGLSLEEKDAFTSEAREQNRRVSAIENKYLKGIATEHADPIARRLALSLVRDSDFDWQLEVTKKLIENPTVSAWATRHLQGLEAKQLEQASRNQY